MRRENGKGIFNATNSLRILSFLAENPGKEFLGSEIQKITSLSRSGVYIALRKLIKNNLVIKKQKGRFILYSLLYTNPVVKQFKVLQNVIYLENPVAKLIPLSKKIILYGSASRGENTADSDLDIFVLSLSPQSIKALLSTVKIKWKIQMVVKSPTDFINFKEQENVFWNEIDRGIVLWEERD